MCPALGWPVGGLESCGLSGFMGVTLGRGRRFVQPVLGGPRRRRPAWPFGRAVPPPHHGGLPRRRWGCPKRIFRPPKPKKAVFEGKMAVFCPKAVPQNGFVLTTKGFATPQNGFASTTKGFATPQNGFALTTKGFAAPQNGFVLTTKGFATPQNGFVLTTKGFVSTQNGFVLTPKGFALPQWVTALPQKAAAAPRRGCASPHRSCGAYLGLAESQKRMSLACGLSGCKSSTFK